MTPTTILIEREADAKVFEVLEAQYPEVKWTNGKEKPTDYIPHKQPDPHKHIDDSDFPYVVSIIDDELTTDGRGRKHITATEWLAQHGYVWDGDGYKYVAPVSAPTRTEQREKELTERGCTKDGNGFWRCSLKRIRPSFVENATDEEFAYMFLGENKPEPQPATYTAGQEVEVEAAPDYWEKRIFHHEYGGKYYCIHHDKPDASFGWDRIRPVQVQPEMPEWEKVVDDAVDKTIDELIAYLRPLITPKQVTDEMVIDKWADLIDNDYDSEKAAVKLVRWALQKAEGGEG